MPYTGEVEEFDDRLAVGVSYWVEPPEEPLIWESILTDFAEVIINSYLLLCFGMTGPVDYERGTIFNEFLFSESKSFATMQDDLGTYILENKLRFCWITKSVDIWDLRTL